jgi:uncharacterized membrane protein YfcA
MAAGVVIFAALLSAVVTAMFGLAGGSIFFAMVTWVLSAKEAIPLHSLTQLMSNTTRLLAFWDTIRWEIVGYFAMLSLLGAYLGSLCFQYFNAEVLEVSVGIFVLVTIFLPKKSGKPLSKGMIVLLGFLSSFLGMIVAVTGPLVSAFFVVNGITKEEMVSTKSVCQAISQVAKMLMFASVIDFDFAQYSSLLVYLALATILGTWVGRGLIAKIPDNQYDKLNNIILGLVALSMILKPLFT